MRRRKATNDCLSGESLPASVVEPGAGKPSATEHKSGMDRRRDDDAEGMNRTAAQC